MDKIENVAVKLKQGQDIERRRSRDVATDSDDFGADAFAED